MSIGKPDPFYTQTQKLCACPDFVLLSESPMVFGHVLCIIYMWRDGDMLHIIVGKVIKKKRH
jgi:hypothetical protein